MNFCFASGECVSPRPKSFTAPTRVRKWSTLAVFTDDNAMSSFALSRSGAMRTTPRNAEVAIGWAMEFRTSWDCESSWDAAAMASRFCALGSRSATADVGRLISLAAVLLVLLLVVVLIILVVKLVALLVVLATTLSTAAVELTAAIATSEVVKEALLLGKSAVAAAAADSSEAYRCKSAAIASSRACLIFDVRSSNSIVDVAILDKSVWNVF
mmetsp:Transcript_27081/g.49900  ORF Transcript_27081/g.49900 Transcript_27081/m.49900 type:complete len:213 (+) Transcript_27081:210-848(+)